MLERAGTFGATTVSQVLLGVGALITWIPLLGATFSALLAVLLLFANLLLGQSIYFVWLVRETERTPILLTLSTTWNFLKEHVRAVIGLYVCFAIVGGAMMLLPLGYGLVWWGMALNVLVWLLGTSYAAALYAGGKDARVRDVHTAPTDLDRMKRANIPEE